MSVLAEGGLMDWTAVFLVSNLGASESVGAYAFGIFAGAMAFGRFIGDKATRRIGHVLMIRLGGVVCAISVLVMLTSGSATIALITLAVCGLGIANMVPAVFAAAGHIGAEAAGKAMSIVKTMGYTGLLVGPALLGSVARASGLEVSLFLVASAFALVVIGSFYIRRRFLQPDFELAHRLIALNALDRRPVDGKRFSERLASSRSAIGVCLKPF
jgi:MFS family permease